MWNFQNVALGDYSNGIDFAWCDFGGDHGCIMAVFFEKMQILTYRKSIPKDWEFA